MKSSLSFIAGKSNSDYKIITDLDPQSKIDYEIKIISEINFNNIYLLNGELENLYKRGKEPSIGKEQGAIETLGNLDGINKLSDFISDDEIRNILTLVIQKQRIKLTAEVIEEQFQEEKVVVSIVKPFAVLDDRENNIRVEDIPF